jgi:hypothetical protein
LDYDFSRKTASAVINDPIHPASQPFTTNQIILINDTFTVDVDFNFTGCQNIILGPGALINVLPPFTLTIEDCTISSSSCSNLSRGILAESGSKVRVRASRIRDCQYGIEARDNSKVSSHDSHFLDNYVGIYFSPNGGSSPIAVTSSIHSTEFASTANLKPKYQGQFPIPLTKPFAGIKMENLIAANIGNFNRAENTFHDINCGIYAVKSNAHIENCTFNSIMPFDPWPNTSPFHSAGSAIYSDGQGGTYLIDHFGRNDQTRPEFTDCVEGIRAFSTSINSFSNYFVNCDIGYMLIGGRNLTIRVNRNHIDCNLFGIVSANNEASIIKEFNDNVIDAGQRIGCLFFTMQNPAGIVVHDAGNFTFGGLIQDNQINIPFNDISANGGILLNNAGNYRVLHNSIYFNNQIPTRLSGISLNGSRSNFIDCNTVIGNRSNFPTLDNDVAMRFNNSASNIISCNNATQTSIGVQFSDWCLGGQGNETVFKTNDMVVHHTGLRYTHSARVDLQENMGNTWNLNHYPGFGAENNNPNSIGLDQYFFDLNQIGHFPYNFPYPVTPFWFLSNNNPDLTCTFNNSPTGMCDFYYPNSGTPDDNQGIASLIKIALDSAQSVTYDEEMRWKAKVMLYEKLLKTPEFLDSSTALSDFYYSYAGSIIRQIAELNIEKENLFENQNTLVQIMKDNAIEIFHKSEWLRANEELLSIGNLNEAEKDSLLHVNNAITISIKNIINYNSSGMIALKTGIDQRVDVLNSVNQNNNGSEVYERNERAVNDVYFTTVAKNNLANIFNYAAILLNIATQCPISGGPSVYRARSLYFLIDPEMVYDDELTCLQNGYLYKTSQNVTHKSKLYPNPSSAEITIVYNISTNADLIITDPLGRIIKQFKLNTEEIETTLSISNFENGIYNYKIIEENGTIGDVGQFIVTQ